MHPGPRSDNSAASKGVIYLDNHATTRVDPRVVRVMLGALTEHFGNPSDRSHAIGDDAARLVDRNREHVGVFVNADAEDVIFASSATVALRKTITHLARSSGRKSFRIAASSVEHPAILKVLSEVSRQGLASVALIEVDHAACLSLNAVERVFADGCDLLCVMAANNEVGTIYPIKELAARAHRADAEILVDACQAAGHLPIDIADWQTDYLVFSAHKMNGPKGAAALVTSSPERLRLRQLLENDSGTLNVPAIAGFGEACRLSSLELPEHCLKMAALRDRLQSRLLRLIPRLIVNGDQSQRLPHSLHISIPSVPSEALIARLFNRVALSSGAACQSGTDQPSHVLTAMRLPSPQIDGALRIAVGSDTTTTEIDAASELIAGAAADILQLTKASQNAHDYAS